MPVAVLGPGAIRRVEGPWRGRCRIKRGPEGERCNQNGVCDHPLCIHLIRSVSGTEGRPEHSHQGSTLGGLAISPAAGKQPSCCSSWRGRLRSGCQSDTQKHHASDLSGASAPL